MSQKASDLFIQCLEDEGVEYIFGVSGEENLDFLDSLSRSTQIKLILTRHEQGAGFMAATYGRHTGKTGLSGDARSRRNQPCYRGGLCTIGRYADDDDHRAETDQKIETGPVPDTRRCGDDGADHQIHAPDGVIGQYPEPRA